jgi:hypothetical protein
VGEIDGLAVGLFVVPLVLLILATMVIVWGVVVWALRRQMRQVRDRWATEGLEVLRGPEMANYRGHARTAIPVRGNGVIGLTAHDLRFSRLVPCREFVVPLAHITQVTLHRVWHGSYRAGMPVIVIHYQDRLT